MTTLDRAFIKAFESSPQPAASAAEAPRAPKTMGTHRSFQAVPPSGATDASDMDMSDLVVATLVEADEPSSRLPLSSFAAQPKVHDSFRALLEIDRADWPAACFDLLARAGHEWDRFSEQLIDRMSQGQKCLALAGVARGDGRTTVSLALARHVAGRGLRPVVVDVDPENPNLLRSCGVSVGTGWNDLVASELALGEALITAVDDGVTLMPWRGPAVSLLQLAGARRTSSIFGTLREHYDLVLLDTLPLVGQTIAEFASFAAAIHLDAVYLVQNVRGTSREQLAAACANLRRAGLPLAGVIENFVSTSPNRPSGGHPSRAAGPKLASLG